MISLRSVQKIYSSSSPYTYALRGLDLEIQKGEALAILGPSGSGKTTLLDILGTLSRPTSGAYYLDSKDTVLMTNRELAYQRNTHFGFVFQMFNLLPEKNVFENIALPLTYSKVNKTDYEPKIHQVLKATRTEHKQWSSCNQLSGGEQQRVAIARALVLDPQIILADEPTGNLDSENGVHIIELLLSLWKSGKTLIMITHNEEIAQQFPRIVRLRDGLKVYDGAYRKGVSL